MLAGGNDVPLLMRCHSTPEIIRRADIDVAVAQLKEIEIPQVRQSPDAPAELLETPFAFILLFLLINY